MAGAVFLGTVISGLVVPQIPQSPCPRVFQYRTQTLRDNSVTVFGVITVAEPQADLALNLFVHLQLCAILPSKYVGLVELTDHTVTSKGSSSNLTYRVRFPLFKPLPTVRLISVNGRVVCAGPTVNGPVVTDIRLKHSLWPLPPSNHEEEPPPASNNYSVATLHDKDSGGTCGQAAVANPLVMGGRPLQPGQWPWLVAIFILTSLGLEFHCSGTIIAKAFILTVAHCMHHEEIGKMQPSDIVISLGKFNLQQWEEPYSAIKEVSEILIHPEFDPNKYTADIALLQLDTTIDYNMFIQPACLWSQAIDLDIIVGKIGTVVGWGKDSEENKLSPIPRAIEIPIVSTEECIESHSEFVFLTSSSTLCAGAKDGGGPCNGDSGSGLMLPVKGKNATRWELRGIVSLSLLNTTTQSCDLAQYIVFTDIAQFLSWISFVVTSSSMYE